jgi:hypothetical protein
MRVSALARAVLLALSEETRRRLAVPMKQTLQMKTPHLFAIKVLDRLPGLFKPHRYLYHCVRCKWSFVVNDGRRGALRPIPENGTPLSRDEVVARAATFASGPCPAMRRVTEVRLHANGASGHVPAHAEESRDFDLGSH